MEVKFIEVLITVFAMVLLAVPGFLLAKFKVLKDGASKVFTSFLLYACQPMLTFMSFQNNEYIDGIALKLLISAGLAILCHAVLILLIVLIYKKRSADVKIRVVRFASVFGNCGYMGLPFLEALFGLDSPVMLDAAVFIAVFNLFNWTIGIYLISGDKSCVKLKKAILNPPMIALIVSLPLFFIFKQSIFSLGAEGSTTAYLLGKLEWVFDVLSKIVTPISMTVLGIRLSEMNFKSVFVNKYAYFASAFKLIACPIIAMLILFPFVKMGLDTGIFIALSFAFSMPCATSALLFSEQFGGDPHTASASVLFSTVASIITVPLISLLIGLI